MNEPSGTRITTSDAARIYRIPARTLQRWVNEGRLTSERRGRAILLSCDELDQLAALRGTARLPATPRMAHHLV
ncbi:helix-turn-helix domain-containing protein [Nonomuraea sp. NPDC050202]|uniref:helix-turn-helix domain-containing protein n=1 Tax=Nonomuraea sp. NPDC050202 TaxID=3155035 RepID=UPI0033F50DCE